MLSLNLNFPISRKRTHVRDSPDLKEQIKILLKFKCTVNDDELFIRSNPGADNRTQNASPLAVYKEITKLAAIKLFTSKASSVLMAINLICSLPSQ